MWDKKGGNVLAAKSLEVFRDISIKAGAQLKYSKKVKKIEKSGDIENVTLEDGQVIKGKKVVVCCGRY